MNGIIASDATYVHADTDQFGQGDEQDGDHGQDQEGEGDEEDGDDDKDGGKKAGYRGRTWTDTEDVLLCEAWMNVSMCGTKGANQKRDAYWARIHKDYTERRSYPPNEDLPNRNVKSVESQWSVIANLSSKFHGCHEQIMNRDESGKNDADKVSLSS